MTPSPDPAEDLLCFTHRINIGMVEHVDADREGCVDRLLCLHDILSSYWVPVPASAKRHTAKHEAAG